MDARRKLAQKKSELAATQAVLASQTPAPSNAQISKNDLPAGKGFPGKGGPKGWHKRRLLSAEEAQETKLNSEVNTLEAKIKKLETAECVPAMG